MPAIESILCPVDLSDASRRALDAALVLARRHDARVRVVHVADLSVFEGVESDQGNAALTAARTALDDKLAWWAARSANGGVGLEVQLREGSAVAGILQEAAAMPADLIVMGAHGKGGFERLALGSVTERVVRKASSPVLVVPAHGETSERAVAFRRVACATDFSDPSARALDYARLLAGSVRAPLSLVTVIDWPFGETSGTDPVTRLRQSLEQEAADKLNDLAQYGDGPPAEIVVLRGKPGREIVRFVRECPADLIVLGVSGRGAVDRALLGSTAQEVLRDAPCPVLAVPAAASND